MGIPRTRPPRLIHVACRISSNYSMKDLCKAFASETNAASYIDKMALQICFYGNKWPEEAVQHLESQKVQHQLQPVKPREGSKPKRSTLPLGPIAMPLYHRLSRSTRRPNRQCMAIRPNTSLLPIRPSAFRQDPSELQALCK